MKDSNDNLYFNSELMDSLSTAAPMNPVCELRSSARALLLESGIAAKVSGTHALSDLWLQHQIMLDTQAVLATDVAVPGRPEKPLLVAPRQLKHRSMVTVEGRAALVHALAHIEFNAINLALDVIWRFAGMPEQYYADWLQVAAEEALHFSLLEKHLQTLGFAYGDFDAHNSLWDMAEKTSADLLARIALVPRTLEARGLDATPAVRAKLAQAGDHAAAAILDVILRDEVGHVATGNRWFGWLCNERGLEPVAAYAELAVRFNAPVLRGPFNLAARRAAGFSEQELALLSQH